MALLVKGLPFAFSHGGVLIDSIKNIGEIRGGPFSVMVRPFWTEGGQGGQYKGQNNVRALQNGSF